MTVESLFLNTSTATLKQFNERIEACVSRLTDDQIWARGQENENTIGNLVLHLIGNVRQWILSGLGGAPDVRDRDSEFTARGGLDAATLAEQLRSVVHSAVHVIDGLSVAQLKRVYTIQGYPVTGLEAVYHVVEHFAQHTGQIIFATKMLTAEDLGFYRHLSRNRKHVGGVAENLP